MNNRSASRGFSLIELVVVISILSILAGVLVPRATNHMKSARDASRLADIKTVRNAIEQYYLDKGEYPQPHRSPSFGNWDVSCDGDFINDLWNEGYLEEMIADPVNDSTHHYRYYVYGAGSYGCEGNSAFYILGIRNFESSEFAKKNKGFFRCSNRDWSAEFAYVTGGGASYRK